MTGGERALAIALATGAILGEITKVVLWVLAAIVVTLVVVLLMLAGMSAAAQRLEYRTRLDRG